MGAMAGVGAVMAGVGACHEGAESVSGDRRVGAAGDVGLRVQEALSGGSLGEE